MDIFKEATKKRLRIIYNGQLSVEDLWTLSLEDLDEIYKKLIRKQRESSVESLINKDKTNAILELQIEIVKAIITTKLADRLKEEELTMKAEKKQKILAIIAEKQDGNLKDASIEDLQKMLTEL